MAGDSHDCPTVLRVMIPVVATAEGRPEPASYLCTHEHSARNRFRSSAACRAEGVVLIVLVWSTVACHRDRHDAPKTRDIYSAARYGDLPMARALLKENPGLAFSTDLNGRTALHLAAANGQLTVAELLLAYNANVNARSASHTTPLHEAAGAGHKEVAELLLTHSADINARDNRGGTPLHWAVLTNRRLVVEMLLARHAAVNAKTSLGYTPLHMAAVAGNMRLVELLRQQGGRE